ncbi:hypothetical protein PR003_g12835 [Phytophthora rubi]|uniref:Uncharacterized protein n=1 Tax=Phytophthora rubi TaxID=129364 RepID=A0A6A4F7C1_9STRA|nr:hypothetical protein PR003_g12835 [Phytophthora rubi]
MIELYPSLRCCRQFDEGHVLAMPARKRATCWAARLGHVQRVVGEPARVGTDAQASVLRSGGATKVLGRPYDVGARGGTQTGEKLVV